MIDWLLEWRLCWPWSYQQMCWKQSRRDEEFYSFPLHVPPWSGLVHNSCMLSSNTQCDGVCCCRVALPCRFKEPSQYAGLLASQCSTNGVLQVLHFLDLHFLEARNWWESKIFICCIWLKLVNFITVVSDKFMSSGLNICIQMSFIVSLSLSLTEDWSLGIVTARWSQKLPKSGL